jgi:DNA adenine methylase
VYLDPPYYEKGANLYLNGYTDKDHARLASFLARPKPFKWVLTYDNTPSIANLYKDFRQIPFDLSYSAYERRIGKELLIYRLDLNLPKESIPQV